MERACLEMIPSIDELYGHMAVMIGMVLHRAFRFGTRRSCMFLKMRMSMENRKLQSIIVRSISSPWTYPGSKWQAIRSGRLSNSSWKRN